MLFQKSKSIEFIKWLVQNQKARRFWTSVKLNKVHHLFSSKSEKIQNSF